MLIDTKYLHKLKVSVKYTHPPIIYKSIALKLIALHYVLNSFTSCVAFTLA